MSGPAVGSAHVVPVNDTIEHDLNDECACGPDPEIVRRDDGTVGWVLVHHSLDARERGEQP